MVGNDQSQAFKPEEEFDSVDSASSPLSGVCSSPSPIIVDTSFVDLTLSESVHFPEPANVVFQSLFDYVEQKLWPLWTDKEKDRFTSRIAPQISLATKHPNKEIFVRRPSSVLFVNQPRCIVDVTVAFAIWGRKTIELRPDHAKLIAQHRNRLAMFSWATAPGFGQPHEAVKKARSRFINLQKQQTSVKKTSARRKKATIRKTAKAAKRTSQAISDAETLVGEMSTPCPDSSRTSESPIRPPSQRRSQNRPRGSASTALPTEPETPARVTTTRQNVTTATVVCQQRQTPGQPGLFERLEGLIAEKQAAESQLADLRAQITDFSKLFYSEAHLLSLAFEQTKHDKTDNDEVERRKRISDILQSMFARAQKLLI